MKPFKLVSDPPKKPKAPPVDVWPEWYGVCVRAGRKAPIAAGPDVAAARNLGKLIPDSAERIRLMSRYLSDKDGFLVANGHPLRMLAARAGKYQNMPELCEPFEVLWALWVRRRRLEEWSGIISPVRVASDPATMDKLAADCRTIVEFNAAFRAYLEENDSRAVYDQWPLSWLPVRLNRKAVALARAECRPDKIEALRAAAREEIERTKIVTVPPVEFVPLTADQVPY